MSYLAEILLGVMAIGVLIGFGSRRDLAGSYVMLLTWPVWLPVMVAGVALERFGFFLKWRGPLDQVQRARTQAYAGGLTWEENSWGPAYAGVWIRDGYVGRWYGFGLPGGRGVMVGRTVAQ